MLSLLNKIRQLLTPRDKKIMVLLIAMMAFGALLEMVAVSILVPLVMWLIFYKVLTVNIPMGPLQFLRDLVDMI